MGDVLSWISIGVMLAGALILCVFGVKTERLPETEVMDAEYEEVEV